MRVPVRFGNSSRVVAHHCKTQMISVQTPTALPRQHNHFQQYIILDGFCSFALSLSVIYTTHPVGCDDNFFLSYLMNLASRTTRPVSWRGNPDGVRNRCFAAMAWSLSLLPLQYPSEPTSLFFQFLCYYCYLRVHLKMFRNVTFVNIFIDAFLRFTAFSMLASTVKANNCTLKL